MEISNSTTKIWMPAFTRYKQLGIVYNVYKYSQDGRYYHEFSSYKTIVVFPQTILLGCFLSRFSL